MACNPTATGINSVLKISPGQTNTYTMTLTVPSVPGCNCGSAVHQPVTVASNNTEITAVVTAYPTLNFSPCAAPFNVSFTVHASTLAVAGVDTAVLTFTFDQLNSHSFTYNVVVRVVQTRVEGNPVDLGDICSGEGKDIVFCNDSDSSVTLNFDTCTCPDLTLSSSSLTISACDCGTVTATYVGDAIGPGSCVISATDGDGYTFDVNVIWNAVYCPFEVDTWEITDKSGVAVYKSADHSADCEEMNVGAIGEYKTVTIGMTTLTQPLVVGDDVYFSQWQFAQIPDWEYPEYPFSGWRYRVCLLPGESPSIDGTVNMEWYGQQPSNENSVDTPYMTLVIGGGGTTLQFILNTHIAADTMIEPGNSAIYPPHDMFLKNTLNNAQELNNTALNSIFSNPKWWSFTAVVWRSAHNMYQQAFLNIRAKFNFYDESPAVASPITLTNVIYTVNSGEAKEYLSTVRGTNIRIDFDWSNYPTPPDDVLLQMIRCDVNNNQSNLYDVYKISLADLTSSTPDGLILIITTPPTYTGSGTTYYTEVTIDTIPGYAPLESVPNTYRFQLYCYDSATLTVLTNCSRLFQTIAYDDTAITFNDLTVNFADNLTDYPSTVNNLRVPVRHAMETRLYWDSALDDNTVQGKTGGVIQTAREAVEGIELRIFKQDPMLGTSALLNTQYFNPSILKICGGLVNRDAQNNEPSFVDRSSGAIFDLTFPITIPDNALRQVTRSNLFQSEVSNPLAWESYKQGSLDCAAQSAGCDAYIFEQFADLDLAGYANLNGFEYIPDIDEIWICDSASDTIIRIDPNTRAVIGTVAMTPGDTPVEVHYLPNYAKCYVCCPGSSIVRIIDIYSLTFTGVVAGYSGTNPQRMGRYTAPGFDLVFIANATSNNVSVVDVATDTEINSIGVGTLPIDCVYGSGYIWVGNYISGTLMQIDPVTLTVLTTTGLAGQPFRLAYCPITDSIWCAQGSGVDVVDVQSLTVTTTVYGTQIGGLGFNAGDSAMYVILDAGTNQLISVDPTLMFTLNTYNTGSFPRDILIVPEISQIWVSNYLTQNLNVWGLYPCNDQLPTYSWASQTIQLEWRVAMRFGGSTETYVFKQQLFNVLDHKNDQPGGGGAIDTVTVTSLDAVTGTYTALPPCNADKKDLQLQIAFNGAYTMLSAGVELMPQQGAFYSDATSPVTTAPIIDPVVSPYVSDIVPPLSLTGAVQFNVNFPDLPTEGDYQFNVHLLLKP